MPAFDIKQEYGQKFPRYVRWTPGTNGPRGEKNTIEEVLVPLLLTDSMHSVQGRTRFQKLVFLIQKGARSKRISAPDFDFELYRHGPFSMELATLLDRLVAERYLEEIPEITPAGHTRYIYHLTGTGRALLSELKQKRIVGTELAKVIELVSRKYGSMPLPRLVREAYKNL